MKRLSIISILVCILALVSGSIYIPVQSILYQNKYGPLMLDQQFSKMLAYRQGKLILDYGLDMQDRGKIIRDTNSTIIFRNVFNGGISVRTIVSKLKNNKYKLDTRITNSSNQKSMAYKKYVAKNKSGVEILNSLEANILFDNLIFPNNVTRRTRKALLAERINDQLRKDGLEPSK